MRLVVVLALILLFVVLALLCVLTFGSMLWRTNEPAPPDASPPLTIAATVFPLADWLREVGGEDVRVHLLVSAQSDPHHFEPTIQDALALAQGRAVFAVGLELDPWAQRLAQNAGKGDNLKFFTTGEWITPRRFSAAEKSADEHAHEAHGAEDPHFWLDPGRAKIVVRRMAEELGTLDPAHRDAYARRAETYAGRLDTLEQQIATMTAAMPPGKQIVTFHDAYGYLLARLGVTVAAVVQVSPGLEPGPRDVAEAVRVMRAIGQRTVYEEPASSLRAANLVAEELGGTVTLLDPLDTEISPAGRTYLERMRYNIVTLAKMLK